MGRLASGDSSLVCLPQADEENTTWGVGRQGAARMIKH